MISSCVQLEVSFRNVQPISMLAVSELSDLATFQDDYAADKSGLDHLIDRHEFI